MNHFYKVRLFLNKTIDIAKAKNESKTNRNLFKVIDSNWASNTYQSNSTRSTESRILLKRKQLNVRVD